MTPHLRRRPHRLPGLHRFSLLALSVAMGGCAGTPDRPPAVLLGGWQMSATIDGVDYVGLLTFGSDGLAFWDGALGERHICEPEAVPGMGGYAVSCPLPMLLVPDDEGQLVTRVNQTTWRESNFRRCLRREERSARMVCVEWEVTPIEERVITTRRIILSPTDGKVIRRDDGGGPSPPGGAPGPDALSEQR